MGRVAPRAGLPRAIRLRLGLDADNFSVQAARGANPERFFGGQGRRAVQLSAEARSWNAEEVGEVQEAALR